MLLLETRTYILVMYERIRIYLRWIRIWLLILADPDPDGVTTIFSEVGYKKLNIHKSCLNQLVDSIKFKLDVNSH